jgi:MFS transporter, DHA3 family, macrolide efflux protein
MRTFLIVWLGQVVSQVGTTLTGFGLGFLTYQRTGSATAYGLILLATLGPQVIASPFLGVLVDRRDRRVVMVVGHAGAGACSLLMAALHLMGLLEVWTILLLVSVSACFIALEFPAFSASTTLLVPKEQLGRANGLVQLGFAVAQVAAPLGAGVLLAASDIGVILIIDVVTFLFAISVLLAVELPRPADTETGREAQGSVFAEAGYGWRFLRDRRGLLAMLLFFGAVNLNLGMVQVLVTPLILGFSTTEVLGAVLSVGGAGMLTGSLVMAAWGGPRRKVYGVLGFGVVQGLAILLATPFLSASLFAGAAFLVFFALPIMASTSETIWQRKVPPDVQGRVFSFRVVVAGGALALAYIVAGPLADGVFEPLLSEGGALTGSLGGVFGVGAGRGVALLLALLALGVLACVAAGYAYRPLRRVETGLPDHEARTASQGPEELVPAPLTVGTVADPAAPPSSSTRSNHRREACSEMKKTTPCIRS